MWFGSAILTAVAAGAIVTGCARSRQTVELEPAHAPVLLEVSNNNWSDMIVYAIRSGQRMRLGTVIATHSASLVLAPDMLGPGGEVRIFAQAIGGNGRYASPRVYASPGGTVSLVLENDLRKSTLTIW